MKKYYIYLFRHGETHYNKNKVFTGWNNSNLTSLGHKQVKILALKLKNKKIDLGFQSPLTRSKVTLKEVLRSHKECKKVLTDKRIIERSYGKLEGIKHDKIIKKYGLEQYEKWHRGYDYRPPEGESFKDVEKRIKPFIKDLKKMIKKEHINIVISAHGNSIRIFKKLWENQSRKDAVKWVIPYDEYMEFYVET